MTDSREELKARIDAMTCEGCKNGWRKNPRDKHEEPRLSSPPGYMFTNCTAKGAEILALLPALKAEGDAPKKGGNERE